LIETRSYKRGRKNGLKNVRRKSGVQQKDNTRFKANYEGRKRGKKGCRRRKKPMQDTKPMKLRNTRRKAALQEKVLGRLWHGREEE